LPNVQAFSARRDPITDRSLHQGWSIDPRKEAGSPPEKEADVARHAAREGHDLRPSVVAVRLQLLFEKLHGALGEPGQVSGQFGSKLLIALPPSVQYSLGKRSTSTSRSPLSAAP
jgi:hypothetical protein